MIKCENCGYPFTLKQRDQHIEELKNAIKELGYELKIEKVTEAEEDGK